MIDDVNFNEEANIKKILVATDGSSLSIKGIIHAIKMAKEKNAEVIALHVDSTFMDMDPKGYTAYTAFSITQDVKSEKANVSDPDIRDVLNKYYDDIGKPTSLIHGEAGLEVAETIGKKQGVKVKTMIERGKEAKTIIKIAKQESIDLIVIGSKGLTGIDKLLLGSVADTINRLAPCPVLIIR